MYIVCIIEGFIIATLLWIVFYIYEKYKITKLTAEAILKAEDVQGTGVDKMSNAVEYIQRNISSSANVLFSAENIQKVIQFMFDKIKILIENERKKK